MAWIERNAGLALIAGGGLALPLSLSLPWFQPGFCPPGAACALVYYPDVTGWEAFKYVDVLITAAGMGALLAAGIGLFFRLRLAFLAVALIGVGAGALILFAVDRPANPEAYAPTHVGFLLALLAGGALVVGGLWASSQLAVEESRRDKDSSP